MKKPMLLVWLCLIITNLSAQGAADVFNASEITWYGLDFTHIKLRGQFTQVGAAGFKDEREIRDVYFEAWNNLVTYHPEKYDFVKTFRVGNVPYDMAMINKKNSTAKVDDMFSSNSSDVSVDESKISKIVAGYSTEKKKGIGSVFIMESFDKGREEGVLWVTFFDLKSKKVLFTDRLVEKAGGIGLKNYWIRTVYNAMVHIQKTQYRNWKSKYGK